MKIVFGLHLDGMQGPSANQRFNEPLVGRLGFLSLLETYLGIAAPEVSSGRRVAVYAGMLAETDNGTRFYSESNIADSVGTAARLLAWRDEWKLGGWKGNAKPDDPLRIRELAAVEQAANANLPPGEAERLHAVEKALQVTGAGTIKSVQLVDPVEDFPLLWRRVLEYLPDVRVSLPAPQGSGALRVVQDRALAVLSGQQVEALPMPADGSVQLVRSLSATTAEHWLSACQVASPADRFVLAEERGDALDTVLSATGSVSCGFARTSSSRPALQALPLALELCWTPLDVPRLLDFLTHPVGPFSGRARAKLAEALAQQPGIGGKTWIEAKALAAEEEPSKDLLEDIAFWIEGERWPRSEGAPIQHLLARVQRMKASIQSKLAGESIEVAAFLAAHRQCAAVHEALQEMAQQGKTRLLPRQIEQLLDQCAPGGTTNPIASAQVGCMRSASVAGACIEAADEVIWWMPATPRLSQALPWSTRELTALHQLGVQLRDPAREVTSLAMHWLRPLLAARKKFVIVAPPSGSEVHPIRLLLKQVIPSLEREAIDLDAALASKLAGDLSEALTRKSLPRTEDAIQLPIPIQLDNGKQQSFSSLTDLFDAPALYVLKRVANLKTSAALRVDEDNRLLGTLSHRVFEMLFGHEDALSWSNAKALAWFDSVVTSLLQEEGAMLLMSGAGISQQRFRLVCCNAICRLLEHVRSAGAIRVIAEQSVAGHLGDIPLTGNIDLQVLLNDGRSVVLDMKWRGDSYYADLLSQGEHLQLAVYSSLIEQTTGKAPAALGYFILESGALYISQPDIFPNAQVRQVPEEVTVATLLQSARATWKWRKEQLDNGLIEVVPDGSSEEHQGPQGTLAVKGPKQWNRDHLVLLGGWE